MFKSSKKVLVIVLVFIVMLSLLMGAYYFYEKYFVNQPLSVTLDNSKFVASYTRTEYKDKPVLKLELNKTESFKTDFYQLLENSSQLTREKDLVIEIQTQPSERLLMMYQQIHPAIYEVLELGNYTFLQDRLKEMSERMNLTKADLTITDDYLFLNLEDNDAYLYCVFNKGKDNTPKIKNIVGSGSK